MPLTFRHEIVGPGLHRFVFPSQTRDGVEHELLLDLHDDSEGRMSCLCEAALHGRFCKHKRLVVRGIGRDRKRAPRARARRR